MPLYPEINFTIKLEIVTGNHENDRNALRTLLLDKLIDEKAGTDNQENTSKYRYNVENLSSNNRIYLTRPVPLNKGFDFLIHVESHIFSNGKDNPKHDDIIDDLKIKKQESCANFQQLFLLIDTVFMCNDPVDVLMQKGEPTFHHGFSVDLILKVLKWFFIEQDVRYWNYSGRAMLMSKIKGILE